MALRGVGEFLCVAAPKIAGGALLFGLNLLLLRFLGVEQYGVYALCVAAILLADAVLGGALDLAVLRLGPEAVADDAAATMVTERAALRLKLAAALVVGAALTAVSGPLSDGAFEGRGAWYLVPITAAAAAAMLVLRSVLVHLQLRRRFPAYGAVDLLHVALKFGAIGLLLWVAVPRVATLVALLGAGPLVAAALGAAWFCRPLFARGRLAAGAYRRLADLAGWYVATVALGAFIGRIDILSLGLLAGVEQAGLFAAGHALAIVPELIGSYLAVVLTPRLREHAPAGDLLRFHRRAVVPLALAAAFGYALALSVGDLVVAAILPPAFAPAARVAMILLPGTLAAMATVPTALPIVMFWRKTLVLRMDCVLLPVLLMLYAAVVPGYGAIGAAWLTCIACVLRSAVVQVAAWRCAGAMAGGEPARA